MLRLAAVVLMLAAIGRPCAAQDAGSPRDQDPVARGRYLATLGGCGDCHSSEAGRYAGGRVLHSGIGAVAAANITPDLQTGIGAWTGDDFYRALHKGVSRKVGHLYPAFPYPHFTKLTREDSDALYAFLRTQPPIRNDPHRNQLPFPLSIRGIMAIWNGLYFHEGEFSPDPARPPDWNRGAYIAEALAHCGACHTPKNALQAEKRDHPFEGGVVEGWFAPNLTREPRTGLGAWSRADLVDFLKTGRNRFTAAGGLMAGVVSGSTSKMDDADLQAVAAYVSSLPPSAPPKPARIDPAAMMRGQAVYSAQCASCHGEGASGGAGRLTPLQGSALVQASNPTTVLRYILSGMKTAVTPAYPQAEAMPGFAAQLDDTQVADVATYIRNAWGNWAPAVSTRQAAKARAVATSPRA